MTETSSATFPTRFISRYDTVLVRGEHRYVGGTQEEFDVLRKLFELAPDHVAQPQRLVKNAKDEIIGYTREYVPGQTLSDYLQQHNFSLPDNIMLQIKDALEAFHKHGFAHGDPHPKNIIITPNGTVKFIDPAGYPLTESSKEDLIAWDRKIFHEIHQRSSIAA